MLVAAKQEETIKLSIVISELLKSIFALGIVDEDRGQLHLLFGSWAKTSDFIVDTLQEWWNDLTPDQQQQTQRIQLKVDNGPESSGVRTQFLKRMVEFTDFIGKPIHLLYYSSYHSKYNPIERC